jgi:hypothetical protein
MTHMPGRRPLLRTPRAGSVTPHRPARLGAAWILALALLAPLSGCSAKVPSLLVRAPKDVNGGKPVYMLVRAVEEASFGVDSYRSVAARVSAPDDSVVLTEVIYPGTLSSFPLSVPAKGQLAVYFLFRSPTGDWKVLLDKPLPAKPSIELSTYQIKNP